MFSPSLEHDYMDEQIRVHPIASCKVMGLQLLSISAGNYFSICKTMNENALRPRLRREIPDRLETRTIVSASRTTAQDKRCELNCHAAEARIISVSRIAPQGKRCELNRQTGKRQHTLQVGLASWDTVQLLQLT